MSYILEHRGENIWRGHFTLFPDDVAVHGVSGRLGGVSKAPYDSLNLGLHVQDDAENVWENRKRFFHSLGLDAEKLVTPEQVHGDHIERVTMADAGRGAKDYGECIPQTDALITDEPGLPLMLCFADCTPIFLLDPEHHAAGLVHGGWKGTVARLAGKTVQRMGEEFGTKPEDLLAGIGPAIGPCCYEIGKETEARFREAFPGHEEIFTPRDEATGKVHVNLWEANAIALRDAGVPGEQIDRAETCTSCEHKWYFSYRADGGRTGRHAAVIALR